MKLTSKQADTAIRLLAVATSNLGGYYDASSGLETDYDAEWRGMVSELLDTVGYKRPAHEKESDVFAKLLWEVLDE